MLFDAEHFFDGYRHNPEYSLRVLEAAARAGADRLVLCDTNGGSRPSDVERTVRAVVEYFGGDVPVGVHLHDDTGCGVANRWPGCRAADPGAGGTINGTASEGNCNRPPSSRTHPKMATLDPPTTGLERLTPWRTTSPSS